MSLTFSWTFQASSEPEDCTCIPVDPESLAGTGSPPLTQLGSLVAVLKAGTSLSVMGAHREQGENLSRHRAVGDSCMEVLCLKNCLSSAVIHFNKGRMERNSFACLHRPALLQQHCSNPGSCAGGEKVVSSERQADRQTDSEPAAPLLCARSSKTIPGAICNQEQNQAAGRAPRETVPVQSWLAF